MPIQETIYARLSGYPALVALVGTKIDPAESAQGQTAPRLTYLIFGAHPEHTHDGEQDLRDFSLQVDCWGANYDSARAIAAQVCAALRASEGSPITDWYVYITNDGTDMGRDYDTSEFRCMVEATIWYRG